MIHKTIRLNEEFHLDKPVDLMAYCPDDFDCFSVGKIRKAILILPGGAYSSVCDKEGEPVALALAGRDVNAFVLKYSIGPYEPPYPFIEGFAAIAYMRKHAKEYNIDPDHIGVMGFSAGGHFASMLGAYCHDVYYAKKLGVDLADILLNGVVLSYPVISMDVPTCGGSNKQLLANAPEKRDEYSVEKNVHEDYPPTFLWTTNEDQAVSPRNSFLMAEALLKAGVRFEFHYYPIGGHGFALADASVCGPHPDEKTLYTMRYLQSWFELAMKFIREMM